jgi:carboxymethylenebutenolidase
MAEKTVPARNHYVAVPASGTGPGVLVIHSWWGLNRFFKGLCDRLAAEGFVVRAPDLYGGRVAATAEAASKLRSSVKQEQACTILLDSVQKLSVHPSVRGPALGVIGFSMGAHWALWLAQQPGLPIGATVFFYGTHSGNLSSSYSAFQGHFAENDDWVSDSARRKLEHYLGAAQKQAELFTYPGTVHWFFEADRADAFDRDAARIAWGRTITFLRQHLC